MRPISELSPEELVASQVQKAQLAQLMRPTVVHSTPAGVASAKLLKRVFGARRVVWNWVPGVPLKPGEIGFSPIVPDEHLAQTLLLTVNLVSYPLTFGVQS